MLVVGLGVGVGVLVVGLGVGVEDFRAVLASSAFEISVGDTKILPNDAFLGCRLYELGVLKSLEPIG